MRRELGREDQGVATAAGAMPGPAKKRLRVCVHPQRIPFQQPDDHVLFGARPASSGNDELRDCLGEVVLAVPAKSGHCSLQFSPVDGAQARAADCSRRSRAFFGTRRAELLCVSSGREPLLRCFGSTDGSVPTWPILRPPC